MRVGIIGCGRMGSERARAAAALGHQIVAVYDPATARAKALASGYVGAIALNAPAEISWSGLDAIFICTPPSLRTEYELAAIDAKLPFFVEKPIAVHASDCSKVLAALRRAPVVQGVGYMNRCRHSVRLGRELLRSTTVLGACCHWIGKKYQVDWWLHAAQSGGPLNEQATHVFDLFRFLVGEISAVAATTTDTTENERPPLRVACALNFVDNQLGTIFYSCEAADKYIGLRIITTNGVLEFSGWDLQLVGNTISGELPAAEQKDIFVIEAERFLMAVEQNEPSLVSCDWFDAYRTQLAVDAARASLESGHLVTIEPQFHLQTAV